MRANRDRPALWPGAERRGDCGRGAPAGCALAGPPRPRPRERGAPTTERPRLAVPRVSEVEGGGVSAGARTSKSPREGKNGSEAKGMEAKGRRSGTAVGTDLARAGSPSPARAQPRGAPDTPTAPHRPRLRVLRSQSWPGRRAAARQGRGRADGAQGERGARRGRLCSPGGPRPGSARGRLASPPRASRRPAARSTPHGRPPPPPRARPARAPAAPRFGVGLSGRPEARVRAESCGSEFAIGRTGIRAPSVPPPSPTRGLPLSSGAAPVAPWRPPREGPAPTPPPRQPEGPLANRSGTEPWVPGQRTSSQKEEGGVDRRVARAE